MKLELHDLFPNVEPTDKVVFIGFEPRETTAYMVAKHSIQRTSPGVKVFPLNSKALRQLGVYKRECKVEGSTGQFIDLVENRPHSVEFSFTRFLVPHLARLLGIKGWVMFMDCDFLVNTDLNNLFDKLNNFNNKALMVVQHDFTPTTTNKMDGVSQAHYDRKLWSAFMCFNTLHEGLDTLTPEVVNTQSGMYLHKFQWLADSALGSIPEDYQFIPGHSSKKKWVEPRIVHYTEKAPWFIGPNYSRDEYADMWWDELEELKITIMKTHKYTRIWE